MDSSPIEITPLEGYRLWAPDYDRILSGNCENPILERCGMPWAGATILDLGCGTGRTAAWIRARVADAVIDGVDFSEAMLAHARAKNLYRTLVRADLLADAVAPAPPYDLAVSVLVANHLDALAPLHRLAAGALKPGGDLLLVEYHPFMVLARREVEMTDTNGRKVFIRNRRHLLSDYITAGLDAGLRLVGCWESEVTTAWAERTPGLAPFVGKPVGLGLRWCRP